MRLSPFLANHFGADHRKDVPYDVWESAKRAATRVLTQPAKFPRADFAYLETVLSEIRSADGAAQ